MDEKVVEDSSIPEMVDTEYGRVVRVLKEQGTFRETDLPIVNAYIEAYRELLKCIEVIHQQGSIIKSGTSQKANPAIAIGNKAGEMMMKYAKSLMLSAESRKSQKDSNEDRMSDFEANMFDRGQE